VPAHWQWRRSCPASRAQNFAAAGPVRLKVPATKGKLVKTLTKNVVSLKSKFISGFKFEAQRALKIDGTPLKVF
jgi:hypothetical protein